MLEVLNRCFKQEMKQEHWLEKLKTMIPSYGQALANDPQLCAETRAMTARVLGLSGYPVGE